MGAICGKVETQGESRKEVEEDLRIDNRKRNSLIFAVIEWVSAVDGNLRVKDQEKLARSRRPVVWRRLHAVDATRVHQTRPGLVSFSILGRFGHRDAPRRSAASSSRYGSTRTS